MHLTFAAFGLLGTAAWAAHSLARSAPAATASRWWSLSSLVGFGIVASLGRTLRQSKIPMLALDGAGTVLTIALAVVWLGEAGPFAMWLAPIPPLLVCAHSASGGRTIGVLSLASASVAYPVSVAPDWALAGVSACIAAAWLGFALLVDPEHRRARPSHLSRRIRSGPGDVIDDMYRLGRRIGKGGVGRVYEARRVTDDRQVALKLLRAELADVGDALARFRREVSVTSRLPANRVAGILDVGSGGPGIAYVAMELLDGEDLAARLRRVRRLSCEDTARIVAQLAEVLDAAADSGVVHRDVKPRNVFLTCDQNGALEVRLLDFGICRLRDNPDGAKLTRSGRILGTPGFLAPEQISSRFGEVGPHTDVFALGCVVYQCLSGHRPFPARHPVSAVYEVLNHHPRPVREFEPEIPEAVEWVLAIALAKQSSERYARASEFAKDLASAIGPDVPARLAERGLALLRSSTAVTSTLTR